MQLASVTPLRLDLSTDRLFFLVLSNSPADPLQSVGTIYAEVIMGIDILALGMSNLAKSIEVQLTNKGRVVVMPVVGRKDIFTKSRNIFNIDGVPICSPSNHRLYALVLN